MLLIKKARVLDPQDRGEMDVLVAGRRIVSMGVDIQPPVLPGLDVEVIDGQGQYLVPGLVDGLVHITGGGGEGGFLGRTLPLIAADALAAGVTTVIGCLGTDAITRTHADLIATARALKGQGVGAYCLTGSYALPARTLTGDIESDLVLIPEIIGLGEVALADHRGSQPDWRQLAAASAETRRGAMLAGKRGTVLIHLGDGKDPMSVVEEVIANTQIPRNQFLPTHCNRGPETFKAACEFGLRGGNIDFTTSTTKAFLEEGEIPAARALAEALVAGVEAQRLTLSSDAQASLPAFGREQEPTGFKVADIGSLWASVRSAVIDHGLAIETALAAATTNPARIFGLGDRGRVRSGDRADLLLVNREQLAITTTISGGTIRWTSNAHG
jgi:beta-aspartyl-dipeptidase (metallo-type)